jgi:acetyltransferase-like isoleucine patch superfamily enzyme
MLQRLLPPVESTAERARRLLEEHFPGVAFGNGVQVIGLSTTEIGSGACVSDQVWLNDCLRDGTQRIKIGHYTLLGRGSMISTAGRLEIADFCLLGPGVFVSDADHVFEDPFQPVLQQGATTGRSVIVEENCWLGMHAKIFGDLVIGRGSVVAGGSIVRESVPCFSVVAGSPARIVKMYDFETGAWMAVRSQAEAEEMLDRRRVHSPPEREAYRETLHRNYRIGPIDPIIAGAGRSV